MSGEEFIRVPNTQPEEAQPFIDSLKAVPKSGLHNPYKNPDRYARIFLNHTLPWRPSRRSTLAIWQCR